ncbi:50S ribosomal protein L15 [archaeon]|nr:50S ribosomal protein L15 [archaeon]
MRNKRKKNSRLRGSKTHGWGSMKKHRGAGNRGGKGKAGTGKRADTKKPTIINLFGNTYFGKTGFTSRSTTHVNAIGVGKLKQMFEKKLINETVDLKKLGFDKLLGSGFFDVKLNIKVDVATTKAIEKVKKAGGNVEVLENKKE